MVPQGLLHKGLLGTLTIAPYPCISNLYLGKDGVLRYDSLMAGLQNNTPVPEELRLRSGGKMLALNYPDLGEIPLTAEFLRVYSPSAEVRGHGQGNEVLQVGKEDVSITGIEPVGNYAVKLIFSDGHDSGLYSWDILHEFAKSHTQLWQSYLQRLEQAGHQRKV